MKQSQYNVIIQDFKDGNAIIFNGISKSFVMVSSRFLDNYLRIMQAPDKYANYKEFGCLIKKFHTNGFVVDDNYDEFAVIKSAYQKRIKEPSYSLLVMTTYACNFKCWYCVQHHQDIELSANVNDKIKKHISKYLIENKIKYFDLSWFGGEPLLNTEAIEDISNFAMSFCLENDIRFSCGITTNGSLLTKPLVKKMRELQFKNFQITIDGEESVHNKTKKNESIRGSFELILRNVVLVVQNIPDAAVTLRVNYTHNNLTVDFPKQVDRIMHIIRDKITLLFRPVWQERDSIISDDSVNSVVLQFREMGYNVEHDFNDFTLLSCYVEKDHYYSVFPDGTIDKCNNKPLEKARGYLDDNGEIVWKQRPVEKDVNIFDANSECKHCKYLPICMGPCPATRENNIGNKIECNVKNRDDYFKRQIEQYCMLSSSKSKKI